MSDDAENVADSTVIIEEDNAAAPTSADPTTTAATDPDTATEPTPAATDAAADPTPAAPTPSEPDTAAGTGGGDAAAAEADAGVGGDDELAGEIAKLQQMIESSEQETQKLTVAAKEALTEAAAPGEVDSRSVFVSNVDFTTTAEDLQNYFQTCGTIQRVTILMDKWTGRPKGIAYVEFLEAPSVQNAVMLNGSQFKGRELKVAPKRTNVPAFQRGRGRGRGRGGYRGGGYRGRGGYRGGWRGGWRGGRGGYPY